MNDKIVRILPKSLKPKDTIAVVTLSAPDANLNIEKFNSGVSYLESKNYEVLKTPHTLSAKGYLVCEPENQVSDLHNAFSNPNVNAIFLSGGGYNANKIIPLIDYDLIRNNPKVIIGMSNMSVVLNAIWAKTGMVTFYGPAVVHNLGDADGFDIYSEEYLWKTLSSSKPIGEISIFTERKCISIGKAKGILVGGNLTSMESLLGTPYEPDWTNKLFFWEDCFMEMHLLDMILTHFKLCGVFNKINGMIIGKPLEIKEEEFNDQRSLPDVVYEICGKYEIPILYNVDFGHNREKVTIPIGIEAEIDSDGKKFSILENCTHS